MWHSIWNLTQCGFKIFYLLYIVQSPQLNDHYRLNWKCKNLPNLEACIKKWTIFHPVSPIQFYFICTGPSIKKKKKHLHYVISAANPTFKFYLRSTSTFFYQPTGSTVSREPGPSVYQCPGYKDAKCLQTNSWGSAEVGGSAVVFLVAYRCN